MSVDAASLPGNRGNSQVLFTAPAAASVPATPVTGNGQAFVPRNSLTGAADYSSATTPTTPVGTMHATFSTPGANAPKVPAPVVLTADAAQKNLADIKAQVSQLTTDVANHKAAMSTPTTTATTDANGTAATTGTTAPVSSPTVSGTSSVDDKINAALATLTGNEKTIDETQTAALTPLQTQQATLQKESDAATVTALNQLNSIASGTYPLSPTETALLDSTKASYMNTIQGQQIANDAFTGQMTELAATLGINTSSPAQAAGMIHAAISEGSDKVADLNGKMAQALATLDQGFQKQDFDMIQASWEDTSKYYDSRTKAISDMMTAVNDAAKAQKQDAKDTVATVLKAVVDSATFDQKTKQDLIDSAFKSQQISETQRHDFATEAISKENADNNSSTGGGSFTKTQVNKGAATAGVDVSEFAAYPGSVKNYYINNPTQAKAFNQLVADRASGKQSSKDVADTISTANVPDDVKTWMYQTAGVDENGNPTDGKQDSGLTADLSAAGHFLGDSYDGIKSWAGIQ